MTEAVNQASDWIATYWPTIVAVVTSSTFIYMVMRFVIQLILIKVRAKTTKILNDDVVKKYTSLESRVNQVVADLEALFTASMEKYAQMTSEQFETLMNQYKKSKKEYLKAILNGKAETVALLEEAREVQKTIEENMQNLVEEQPVVEEEQPQVEEICEEPKVEDVEPIEEPSNIVETQKENEYIVVKKVYGE